jgi:hypothetical protein
MHWSGCLLHAIRKLPVVLQYEIYKLIDIDTKLELLMEHYPSVKRIVSEEEEQLEENLPVEVNTDILEWFTEKEATVIYRQGYLGKFYHYNIHTRRWNLQPAFVDKLPKITMLGFKPPMNVRGQPSIITTIHPVYDMIDNLRVQEMGSVKDKLTATLSFLMKVDVYDIKFNYYLRKVALSIMNAIVIYKRTCIITRSVNEETTRLIKLEKERIRAEKMAQREIELEEERQRLHREREMEQQRIFVERQNLQRLQAEQREQALREKEENKRLKTEQREQALREKEENKRLKVEQREQALREKEENKRLKTEQREQALREKEENKRLKVEQREQALRKKEIRTLHMVTKKEEQRRKTMQILHNQTLSYICKLFK